MATDRHTDLFNNLPMPTLQALMKVIDTLDSPEQLDEMLRLAQAPVIEGKGGALGPSRGSRNRPQGASGGANINSRQPTTRSSLYAYPS